MNQADEFLLIFLILVKMYGFKTFDDTRCQPYTFRHIKVQKKSSVCLSPAKMCGIKNLISDSNYWKEGLAPKCKGTLL